MTPRAVSTARRAAVGERAGLSVGLDGGRIHGLRVAGDQPPGHARGKAVVEQALEDGGWEELPDAAHG